jgi:hypothetical protein
VGDSGDRRRGVLAKAASLVVVGLLLSGCSPVPADPRAVLEEKAATIDSVAQDLLEALDAAGLSGASAGGFIDSCQSVPAPGVSYRAAIGVTVGEDLVSGFDALSAQLDASGWKSTEDLDDPSMDPEAPARRFVRDDITLDVKTGGSTAGGVHYGADRMTLGLTISNDCVRVPDGGYIAKVQDLEKEILPRE